jgi:transcription antitermination factor NusG
VPVLSAHASGSLFIRHPAMKSTYPKRWVQRRIETFLPFHRITRRWKKSLPVVLELPLFPTYVFVRIRPEAKGSVLSVPGVLSIVGSAREPWSLPDTDIEGLRLRILERTIEPHPYLNVGQIVRIKAGVMTGVQGILVRKKNDFRVVISLNAIMRSVAVEVDVDDIEPVEPANKCPQIT